MRIGSPAVTFVFHLGVHCTDETLLVRSLLKNGDDLNKRQVIVPRPRRYRAIFTELTQRFRGNPMPDDEQQALYDHVIRDDPAERVIFSSDSFLCPVEKIFEYQDLYGRSTFRTTWLRYLWPENPCEFHLAIRNPATFVPAAMQAAGAEDVAGFLQGVDPLKMRWSRLIKHLQDGNPGCPITVWCNEDTPLIWPTILREITDTAPEALPLEGEWDVLRAIMTEDGLAKMQAYIDSHNPANDVQRRRIFAAFLDKFAREDVLDEQIDLAGWTPDYIDEVTAAYDDDVYRIERMPGVTFLAA